MDRDPGLLCFKHCQSDIFAVSIPNRCPECDTDLSQCSSITPFRVPFPFKRASQYPCSVVLKPTKGDFLKSYKNNADLHIGLTDSKGNIFSFDEKGLKKDAREDWDECLLIECALHPGFSEDTWDAILQKCLLSKDWTLLKYDENNYNCYTFALYVIQSLHMCHLHRFSGDRKSFCKEILIPLTVPAGKYISLYRRVTENGFYVKEKNCT